MSKRKTTPKEITEANASVSRPNADAKGDKRRRLFDPLPRSPVSLQPDEKSETERAMRRATDTADKTD